MKEKRSSRFALIIVFSFLAVWELLVYIFKIPVYLLPAPSRVLLTLFSYPGMYLQASLLTLGEALAGLLLGILAGALAASLLTINPQLENGVMTLAILIKSTPLVAIAPLLTIWLGFGVLPKIIITALLTFSRCWSISSVGCSRPTRPLWTFSIPGMPAGVKCFLICGPLMHCLIFLPP